MSSKSVKIAAAWKFSWIFFGLAFFMSVPHSWAQASQNDTDKFCEEILNTGGGLNIDEIRNWMEKGSEWAVQNLTTEQLSKIKSYILYEENLKFRCREFVPKPIRNPVERPATQVSEAKKSGAKQAGRTERNIPLPRRKPI